MREAKMKKTEMKRLRGYLKGYRLCLLQAKSIDKQLAELRADGEVRELLRKAKEEFDVHCRNVQLILGQTKENKLEYSVLNLRYVEGKSMKEVAKAVGYNAGYCANIESDAIERLSADAFVMGLIPKSM